MKYYINMYFYKGSRDILSDLKTDETQQEIVKKDILQVFDVKNLSFLIGAGCSSYLKGNDKQEIGIPVMSELAREFYCEVADTADKAYIASTLKINIAETPFDNNLETFMEVLHSYHFLLQCQNANTNDITALTLKVTSFLLRKCINKDNNSKNDDLIHLYSLFYKKLIYRDSNLSKPNIFTTNYDLYSETALDQLGILYANGFTGLVERYFNPIVFNYAFAEQMELSNNKWNVIDNFIYLYKLHGSINWIESKDQNHLFKVKEIQQPDETAQSVMIYPTPMKQVASFASPYSDLFREFQKKLMQDKNVLVAIGYSFSDEHINSLIYQALTIPNFRLIIFQNSERDNIKRLIALNDPRIWVIGGTDESKTVHYFNYVVTELMPDIDQEQIEESVDKVLKTLLKSKP